jgi:hypothetical protein
MAETLLKIKHVQQRDRRKCIFESVLIFVYIISFDIYLMTLSVTQTRVEWFGGSKEWNGGFVYGIGRELI